jgi:hypothetical protein
MMMGVIIGVIVPTSMLVVCILELRKRWQLRLRYLREPDVRTGEALVVRFAFVRRKVGGWPTPFVTVVMAACVFLMLFFGPALVALSQLSPEEALRKFQEIQQERR